MILFQQKYFQGFNKNSNNGLYINKQSNFKIY